MTKLENRNCSLCGKEMFWNPNPTSSQGYWYCPTNHIPILQKRGLLD